MTSVVNSTEYFTTVFAKAKTLYMLIMRMSNRLIWNVTDSAFGAKHATQSKISMTENAAAAGLGDNVDSLYWAEFDLNLLNSSATPAQFVVQFVNDLGTDEIIATEDIYVTGGQIVSSARKPL